MRTDNVWKRIDIVNILVFKNYYGTTYHKLSDFKLNDTHLPAHCSAQGIMMLKSRCHPGWALLWVQEPLPNSLVVGRIYFTVVVGLRPQLSI